jgi:hypothetical protein
MAEIRRPHQDLSQFEAIQRHRNPPPSTYITQSLLRKPPHTHRTRRDSLPPLGKMDRVFSHLKLVGLVRGRYAEWMTGTVSAPALASSCTEPTRYCFEAPIRPHRGQAKTTPPSTPTEIEARINAARAEAWWYRSIAAASRLNAKSRLNTARTRLRAL